jgi:DNA-binding response OmpR family regulator
VTEPLLAEQDLPGRSGFELQLQVLDRAEMPIIFMTHHPDIRSTVQAMSAGAFELLVTRATHGAVVYNRTPVSLPGQHPLHQRLQIGVRHLRIRRSSRPPRTGAQ